MNKQLDELIEEFTNMMIAKGQYSSNTIQAYRRDLINYAGFIKRQGSESDSETLTEWYINDYLTHLDELKKSGTTVYRNASTLKSFASFLKSNGYIKSDISRKIKFPAIKRKEPDILTYDEVVFLLNQPQQIDHKGRRDKAILEILYSTGVKVTELIKLKIEDIDIVRKLIFIRDAKKTRAVPLSEKASQAVAEYISDSRNKNTKLNSKDLVFINAMGKALTRQGIWKIIKNYAVRAKIKKNITPNTLRSSFAVHCLEKGENIEKIKEYLGHNDVLSTQVYAIAAKKLKDSIGYPNNAKEPEAGHGV